MLNQWLNEATFKLSTESSARVRTEIQEHYELAREEALASGVSETEADIIAVKSLGDARTANRQYRRVLLTASEAKMLKRQRDDEAASVRRPWVRWLKPAYFLVPALLIVAYGPGWDWQLVHWLVFAGVLELAQLLVMQFLPVYTVGRGRVYRWVLWGVFVVGIWSTIGLWGLVLIFVLGSVLNEWQRACIRGKLPVAEWPKRLYL